MKTLMQIVLFFLSSTSFGQDLVGQWNGTLSVQGTSFRIVFHVLKTDKQYVTTMDSPDQNASGISVTATSLNQSVVRFEISTIGMVYEGTLVDNKITGKWMQSGQTFPFDLVKEESEESKK